MGGEIGQKRLELRGRDRLVVVPPDMRFGTRVANDELVLGRAARMLSGFGDQGAMGGQPRLTAADGLFIEFGLAQIVLDKARRLQSRLLDSEGGITFSGFRHAASLQSRWRVASSRAYSGAI